MGAVMVRCPQTGRDIPTGLVTDRKSFESMPVFFARVHCPICRTELRVSGRLPETRALKPATAPKQGAADNRSERCKGREGCKCDAREPARESLSGMG